MRVEARVGKQLVGQRLQPRFAGHHALGAALGLEGQVQVFQLLFGGRGVDGGQQFGRHLALLGDAFDHGGAAVFQLAQIAQARLQLAQLDVVQAAGHFFAVTGDEGDGGAAIEQFHGGLDLLRADTDFSGQLGQDFLHRSVTSLDRKRASLPQSLSRSPPLKRSGWMSRQNR